MEQIHANVHVETYPAADDAFEFPSRDHKMKFADAFLHSAWTRPNRQGPMDIVNELGEILVSFNIQVTEFKAECGTPADHLKRSLYEVISRGPNAFPDAQKITAWDTKGRRMTLVWGTQVFDCKGTRAGRLAQTNICPFIRTLGRIARLQVSRLEG